MSGTPGNGGDGIDGKVRATIDLSPAGILLGETASVEYPLAVRPKTSENVEKTSAMPKPHRSSARAASSRKAAYFSGKTADYLPLAPKKRNRMVSGTVSANLAASQLVATTFRHSVG